MTNVITITSVDEWRDFCKANADAFTRDEFDCILIDAMTEHGALFGGGAEAETVVFFRSGDTVAVSFNGYDDENGYAS